MLTSTQDPALIEFRNRFNLPSSDAQTANLEFFKPADDSAEMRYLHTQRTQLGGYLPRDGCRCSAGACAGQLRGLCHGCSRQGNVHDDGLCAHVGRPAEGQRIGATYLQRGLAAL